MKRHVPILLAFALLPALPAISRAQEKKPAPRISWKKTILDSKFRSEGVAVADVNKDGKPDVLVGDYWYEAPDWKAHEIRKPGNFGDGSGGYSQSFACWADDLNGDGWPDLIVIGFPGAPCHWYENPQGGAGHWKQHVICKSACNETPQYVDLFGTGKRALVMGYEEKQMVWVAPGKDPTQPWDIHSISDPKDKAPGTARFAHGLGVGDINGDGKLDVICTDGWWKQPAKDTGEPWTFHRANLGPACADMYALDVDGDGKADVVSSAAHDYGFWVHLQRGGGADPSFVLQPLFPTPPSLAKVPADAKLNKEEAALYEAINKARTGSKRSPLAGSTPLCAIARNQAERAVNPQASLAGIDYPGKLVLVATRKAEADLGVIAQALLKEAIGDGRDRAQAGCEIGVGYAKDANGNAWYALVIGAAGKFSLPGQTHALEQVDIDGDGVKDFVTGRRWWAHGPGGDVAPMDPPHLYWFQARRDSKGGLTLTPHLIDETAGIGTQFTLADMNGDGLPDVIISNKRGVCVILQVREPAAAPPPVRKE